MPTSAAEAALIKAFSTCATNRTGPQLRELTGMVPDELYPALKRLLMSGVVVSYWPDAPMPLQRQYRLAEGDDE